MVLLHNEQKDSLLNSGKYFTCLSFCTAGFWNVKLVSKNFHNDFAIIFLGGLCK